MAALHPIVTPSPEFLKVAKVLNPKGCSIELDKVLRENILVMKGDPTQTRVQLPREDRPSSSLQLRHSLVTLQVNLNAIDHFGIELTLSQSAVVRMRLVIGTFIREARHDQSINGMCTAHLPLIIPRNRWVQVVFHISGIVDYLFGMPPIKSIDSIALTGTAKVSRLMTSSDEQSCIDATPEGMALFAVPAYAPPIWNTAAKLEHNSNASNTNSGGNASSGGGGHATAENAAAAAAARGNPSADSPIDSGKHNNALPPLSNTSSSSNLHGTRGPSGATKLEPVERVSGDSSTRISPHDSTTNPHTRVEVHLAPQPSSAPPTSTNRRGFTKPQYIRLVDGNEFQPIQPKTSNNSASPRRIVGANRESTGVTGDAWMEITGWEEDLQEEGTAGGGGTTSGGKSSEKGNPTSRRNPKKEGSTAAEERNQKLLANRRARSQSQGRGGGAGQRSQSSKDENTISPAVRRRRRVRRRLQILKANEMKNNKNMVAKSLHASEIPIAGNLVPPDSTTSSQSEASHDHDPKYGYGFGYLGILREDGEYEVDENADLRMKGALTLQLSDDEQDDEE